MVTITAYDPRKLIRETIGTEKYINGEDTYIITVTNNRNDTIDVPLYLPPEVHDNTPPPLPYVEMKLMSVPGKSWNIGGDVHVSEAYMDFDITYIPRTNVIDTDFGEKVADTILDSIVSDHSDVGLYMEVVNDGRETFEGTDGRKVIYRRIMEIYSKQIQKK